MGGEVETSNVAICFWMTGCSRRSFNVLALLWTFARWKRERIGIDLWNLNDMVRYNAESRIDVLSCGVGGGMSLVERVCTLTSLNFRKNLKANFQHRDLKSLCVC